MNPHQPARRPPALRSVALWSVLLIVLCVAVATVSLPIPTSGSRALGEARPQRLEVAQRRTWAVRRELEATGLRYRALATLARWQARASSHGIVIDDNIPAGDRPAAERTAARAWATGVSGAQDPGVSLFVTLDTASMTLLSRSALRGSEMRYFALPSAASANRCVALVRLRFVNESSLGNIRLGPCAFYARYGHPGPRIREWIEATGAVLAARTDLEAARQFETRSIAVSALGRSGGGCLVRGGDFCLEAVGLQAGSTGRTSGAEAAVPGLIGSAVPQRPVSLGERQVWFLADLARELGQPRFTTFWRSGESPEVAFRRVAGMELADWTRRWLQRGVMPVAHEAAIGVPNVAWSAALVIVLFAAAVRRRERVMLRAGTR